MLSHYAEIGDHRCRLRQPRPADVKTRTDRQTDRLTNTERDCSWMSTNVWL